MGHTDERELDVSHTLTPVSITASASPPFSPDSRFCRMFFKDVSSLSWLRITSLAVPAAALAFLTCSRSCSMELITSGLWDGTPPQQAAVQRTTR